MGAEAIKDDKALMDESEIDAGSEFLEEHGPGASAKDKQLR
jgi:hypothetical protein